MTVRDVLSSTLLSQSSINVFLECQKRYKLQYTDKKRVMEEGGITRRFDYGWLGSIIHQILEEFYDDKNFPTEEEFNRNAQPKIEAVLMRLLDEHWDYGQPEMALIDAKAMLHLFSVREAKRWEDTKDDTTLIFKPTFTGDWVNNELWINYPWEQK